MVRPKAAKCGDCETCLTPKSKRACLRPPTAASAEEPCPLPSPLAKRQCTAPEKYEPAESLRDWRQPDGKRRPDPQPSPSPSPQQPRPMTSLTSLQLWLNKPKIDQRVQELERQIYRSDRPWRSWARQPRAPRVLGHASDAALRGRSPSEEGGQEGSPGHRCPARNRAGAA